MPDPKPGTREWALAIAMECPKPVESIAAEILAAYRAGIVEGAERCGRECERESAECGAASAGFGDEPSAVSGAFDTAADACRRIAAEAKEESDA
jgi:hypothetical protein